MPIDLVAKMVAGGVPYDDAVIISDLALHATEEAQKTMTRVSDTAPERVQVPVLMLTVLMMENVIADCKDFLNKTYGVDVSIFKGAQQ
jgi:hypothetical protein